MRGKILKTLVSSLLVVMLTILSACWSNAESRVDLQYYSIEEFLADFGTKIEKQDSNDACCLFKYDAIKTSVAENLQCEVEFGLIFAHVKTLGGGLRPLRYLYENTSHFYILRRGNNVIGEIVCRSYVSSYSIKYETTWECQVDGIDVGIGNNYENWIAKFAVPGARVVLEIRSENCGLSGLNEEKVLDIITPIIESRYSIK